MSYLIYHKILNILSLSLSLSLSLIALFILFSYVESLVNLLKKSISIDISFDSNVFVKFTR